MAVAVLAVVTGAGTSTLALHGAIWCLLGKHFKQTVLPMSRRSQLD